MLLLVGRGFGFILPSSVGFLVDEVIGKGRLEWLGWLLAAGALGVLIQAVSAFGLAQLLSVTAQHSVTELRQKVEQHVVRLPVSFFDTKKTGELISRVMHDAEGIRDLVGTGLVYLAGSVTTACVALGVLLTLNWRFTLVTLAVMLAFTTAMMASMMKLRPLYKEMRSISAEVTGRLTEVLGGIRVVKIYAAEKREDRLFAAGTHRLFRATRRTILASTALGSLGTLSFGLLTITLMWIGAREIVSGAMSLGDFMMYVVFTGLLVAPALQIASLASQLSRAFAGLDRIRELRQLATEAQDDDSRSSIGSLVGELRFEDVSFSYLEDVPVLDAVSFEVPAGTTTALVGPSGAGKSTVFRLAMAFDDPGSGVVRVDGRDLSGLRRGDYRRHLGVVLQDGFLFDGTVRENIAYSRPGASHTEVAEVGRLAHCHEFVDDFENGYDTLIGERGVRLSGGQRQRVAIARALLADPRILLLDEATSNLESRSEAMIQDGLRALRRGRTTLVIAHRLSTIRSADQILVIEGGRILERGTHAELLRAGGQYRELWEIQSSSEEPDVEPEGTEEPAEPEPGPFDLSPSARRSLG